MTLKEHRNRQAFACRFPVFLFLRIRLLPEQFSDLVPGLLDKPEACMGVDAHGRGHVGMPADVLQGLQIDARFRHGGNVAVPEDGKRQVSGRMY